MTSTPLVSVIIPVYNGTNYLAEAVASVFAQTYQNIELIVVDDGSTDGTWELVQSFVDRVRAIRKENGGVATALNRGIEAAHGKYIAWLSHDDLFLPGKLERQVQALQRDANARACYTDFREVDPHGATLKTVSTPSLDRIALRRFLFGWMFISGSTMLIDRECFDRLGGFREDLRYTQDAEMWLRILGTWDIVRIPEVLGLRRTHPDQGSREHVPHAIETQRMLGEVFDTVGSGGLFPGRWHDEDSPMARAECLVWFGDVVARYRYWFDFADSRYRLAMKVWPSWRNSALPRRLAGARAWSAPVRWYRRGRHRLGEIRQRIGRALLGRRGGRPRLG